MLVTVGDLPSDKFKHFAKSAAGGAPTFEHSHRVHIPHSPEGPARGRAARYGRNSARTNRPAFVEAEPSMS